MPQSHVVVAKPAKSARWAIARGMIVFAAELMLLALRLLEREHPTRVFTEARLSESLPSIDRSLDQGRVKSWAGEAVVGTTLLAGVYAVFDFTADTLFGTDVRLMDLLSSF